VHSGGTLAQQGTARLDASKPVPSLRTTVGVADILSWFFVGVFFGTAVSVLFRII
jgi:hypothetical protein